MHTHSTHILAARCQASVAHCKLLQHTDCNNLQHTATATHCNTLQHTTSHTYIHKHTHTARSRAAAALAGASFWSHESAAQYINQVLGVPRAVRPPQGVGGISNSPLHWP